MFLLGRDRVKLADEHKKDVSQLMLLFASDH